MLLLKMFYTVWKLNRGKDLKYQIPVKSDYNNWEKIFQ